MEQKTLSVIVRWFIMLLAIGLVGFLLQPMLQLVQLEQLVFLITPYLYTALMLLSGNAFLSYAVVIAVTVFMVVISIGLWRQQSWSRHAIIMVLFVGMAQSTVFLYLMLGKGAIDKQLLFGFSLLIGIVFVSTFLRSDMKGLFTAATKK